MVDFAQIAKEYGLPFALVFFALLSGALDWWRFSKPVDRSIAQLVSSYEARISDKDAQIARLDKLNDGNASIAAEMLGLAKQQKDALERIDAELRNRRREDRTKGSGGG